MLIIVMQYAKHGDVNIALQIQIHSTKVVRRSDVMVFDLFHKGEGIE